MPTIVIKITGTFTYAKNISTNFVYINFFDYDAGLNMFMLKKPESYLFYLRPILLFIFIFRQNISWRCPEIYRFYVENLSAFVAVSCATCGVIKKILGESRPQFVWIIFIGNRKKTDDIFMISFFFSSAAALVKSLYSMFLYCLAAASKSNEL